MASRSLSPSEEGKCITDGQIAKILSKIGDALRKCCKFFSAADVQVVLTRKDLSKRMVSALIEAMKQLANEVKSLADEATNAIICVVRPNYNRTPHEMLKALEEKGWIYHRNERVAGEMPTNGLPVASLEFIKFPKTMNDSQIEAECERRFVRLATPYELVANCEQDPEFLDEHPSATIWKDKWGNWCHITLCYQHGRRHVAVIGRGNDYWTNYWWFAVVRE